MLPAAVGQAETPPLWKQGLVDGDRVLFLGNTFIEREQREGYIETALTAGYPDRHLIFRNLGWSGDDVSGRSRGRFGGSAEGWKHLNRSLDLVKPTAAIVCYGSNAAFAGEAGLESFQTGYNRLLDALERHTKKIMLLSPPPLEDLGRPLPDPQSQNARLAKYRDAIKEIAYQRGYAFVDLYEVLGEKFSPGVQGSARLTGNGVHLTEYGYWEAARAIEQELGLKTPAVDLAELRQAIEVPLTTALPAPRGSVSYDGQVQDVAADLIVRGGAKLSGRYVLTADEEKLGTVTAEKLQSGVGVNVPSMSAAAEKLRHEIVAKNELFFHRYRPQNETYLLLFRKHEQGNNAAELPLFDPLIDAKEAEIAKLRQPVKVQVSLTADP